MIAHLLLLTRWEWYKLLRRRMLWVLLAVVIVVSQIPLWVGYVGYRNDAFVSASFSRGTEVDGVPVELRVTCVDIREGRLPPGIERLDEGSRQEFLDAIEDFRRDSCDGVESTRAFFRASFMLPSSIAASLGAAHWIGVILLVILTSSSLGVEYGWGTLRAALTRGVGRWQFLTSKVLSLVLMGVAGLVVVAITTTISSLICALTLNEGGGLAGSGEWVAAAVALGKVSYGLLPYVVLTMFFVVLTSSVGTSLAIVMAYHLVELIFVPILSSLLDGFKDVADYLLGPNVAAWLGTSVPQVSGFGERPDTVHALLVLMGYILVVGAATFWLFRRKDVAGATGS